MAGEIKGIIDTIIARRSKGNPTIALTTKTKFILKGIDPDRYDRASPDDPVIIAKVKAIAVEMGVGI
jgi:hypothetical protein